MALIHQGAAWLPRSLIAQDLHHGRLRELGSMGSAVPLTIVAYFANRSGNALQSLIAQLMAARSGEVPS
jgi:DNA-binding transcriptional LysR family regulator